jgi:hypothetical protein
VDSRNLSGLRHSLCATYGFWMTMRAHIVQQTALSG